MTQSKTMPRRADFVCLICGLFLLSCTAKDEPEKLVPLTDSDLLYQSRSAVGDAFIPATFQQTFLFIYAKKETGQCNDLTVYYHLLDAALHTSEKQLPQICHVQDTQDTVTGQLVVSDVEEHGQNILVNVTLMYDQGQSKILERCKDTVHEHFEQTNSSLTEPLRDTFSPMYCPAIYTESGALLVHSGYFCRDANQIQTQAYSQGSSTPIIVCEFCPVGEEKWPGSNVCTPCQQGFYKSDEAAVLCTPCPAGYVTMFNGSTSRHDCSLRACDAGTYANATEQGVCKACPFGTFQPERWQQFCVSCPAGFTAYQEAAVSLDVCLPDCKAGQEYSNTTQTCEPCPTGYYNDDLDPSRFTCAVCPMEFITARTRASSLSECTVRNCTVMGQYRDAADNVCRECPRGQWQNQKWQTFCYSCDVGLTTEYTGASDPAACYQSEEGPTFQDNDNVVIGMLAVLVALVIGNLVVVGYCLFVRRHHQLVIPVSTSGDGEEIGGESWKASNRRGSWEYQDIDLYDIIRDVLPHSAISSGNAVTSQSTFRPIDSGAEAAAAAPAAAASTSRAAAKDFDAIIYTEQRKYAVACSAGQKDLVDLQTESAAVFSIADTEDDPIYDDVINTCPIYENAETLALGTSLYASSRPSRQDILY
ncbi:uncharacterized protein [Littorina saxatilis]|uniref:uncharacterized protein n=1 Tax=Littorina saxatilis TaxID=31220 RepID=UPI0038B43B7C